MALDNSTIQHPLPGDLQARVENALNLVTSLEAEHARLAKLIGSMKGEINALHEEKKSLEKQLSDAKTILVSLNDQIEKSHQHVDELSHSISDSNHQLEEATRQKVEALNEVAHAKEEVTKMMAVADERLRLVETREQAIGEKEHTHQKKVERLLEALK